MHRAPIRILALLAVVAVVAACGRSDAPQGGDLPCGGNASGGFSLTDLADATYSVSFSEDTTRGESMHIRALFVGRGAPGWKGRAQGPATRPVRPDTTVPLAGASLGRLYMGYEDRTNTAWVHDQRVPLDSFNILLVDRVDSAGGPPVVARKLRITPDIPLKPGTCGARATATGQGWVDSLRAVMLRNPAVREFAAGR